MINSPVDENLHYCMLNTLENSCQAIIYYNKTEKTPFFSNKRAKFYFADQDGNIDVYAIFRQEEPLVFLENSIRKQLENQDSATIHHLLVTTNQGEEKVCNVQVGYAHNSKHILFIEILFVEDTAMEQAKTQVDLSPRAEAILNFDKNLSVIHCNNHFHQVFGQPTQNNAIPNPNEFRNGLQKDYLVEIIADIRENLEKSPYYFTKIKLVSRDGQTQWHSLELQRRALDGSGTDKVMAYLLNIEEQVEAQASFRSINQYFGAIQALSDDLLFTVDMETKILTRRQRGGDGLILSDSPVINQEFPQSICQNGHVHPKDQGSFIEFGRLALEGKPATVEVRMKADASGKFEYRQVSSVPIFQDDGSVKELFGKVVDIHKTKELENTVSSVRKQVEIIEKITNESIFFVDCKTKLLIHRGNHPQEIGIQNVEENYPECVFSRIHPDDLPGYKAHTDRLLSGQDSGYSFRQQVKSGEYSPFRTEACVILDKEGQPLQIVGSIRREG